jgi:hypothetical protein
MARGSGIGWGVVAFDGILCGAVRWSVRHGGEPEGLDVPGGETNAVDWEFGVYCKGKDVRG